MSIWRAFNEGQKTVMMKNQQDMDQARQDALLAIQNKKLKMDEEGQEFTQDLQTKSYNQQVNNDQRNFDYTKERAAVQDKQFEMTAFASPENLIAMNKAFGTNYTGKERITFGEVGMQTGIHNSKIQEAMKNMQGESLRMQRQAIADEKTFRLDQLKKGEAANTEMSEFFSYLMGSAPAGLEFTEEKGRTFLDYIKNVADPTHLANKDLENRQYNRKQIQGVLDSIQSLKEVYSGQSGYKNLNARNLGGDLRFLNIMGNLGADANAILGSGKYGLSKKDKQDLATFLQMVKYSLPQQTQQPVQTGG